jgi:beta-glucosidase
VRADGRFGPEPGHPLTVMGYEDRPQALAETCRYVWARTKTPIIVTENGWAGENDTRRIAFIRSALTGLHGAIAEGVDVGGYFYWSLIDNFEWLSGYAPKFGLLGVDRTTQQRQIKPSAVAFGEIARMNAVSGPTAE